MDDLKVHPFKVDICCDEMDWCVAYTGVDNDLCGLPKADPVHRYLQAVT